MKNKLVYIASTAILTLVVGCANNPPKVNDYRSSDESNYSQKYESPEQKAKKEKERERTAPNWAKNLGDSFNKVFPLRK